MEPKVLISGFEFAVKYDLTKREMEVLRLFLEKPLTTAEASKVLDANPTTLHHTIQRLKLKQMLVLKSRDSVGNNLYMFNSNL